MENPGRFVDEAFISGALYFIISSMFISGCMKMGENYLRPELDINIPKVYNQEDKKLSASDLTILQNRVTLHRALGGGWGLLSHESN
ncbi:hypothetical protein [Desulfobacterium sp. N47]|uniref:Uncharacterized protein n=1 Tax=uncultured Desulfobacterium sp. TaxID=201089 RepID=E1YB79_9BACT|nr:unknown protein [uncultured Desulfobacterium sp.]